MFITGWGGVSMGAVLIFPIRWLEVHHFWRMPNSVMYRVSAIYYDIFSFSLHCQSIAESSFSTRICNWPSTSLNQFRMLNFLCKIDFSLLIHIKGPPRFQSVMASWWRVGTTGSQESWFLTSSCPITTLVSASFLESILKELFKLSFKVQV